MGTRPTIQMVADFAGVSRGTVDRVLNQRSYVRADVRERVLAAIAEIGYVSPHAHHQNQLGNSLQAVKLGIHLHQRGKFAHAEALAHIVVAPIQIGAVQLFGSGSALPIHDNIALRG